MQTLKAYRATFIFIAIALFVVAIGTTVRRGNSVKWVGRTDLVVHFSVTDAETGLPVSNATVGIRSESGGFCDDREPRSFTIATDANGNAKHTCTNCMCFGSRSAFENTFVVHLPWWWFRATATGYSDFEPEYLDLPANIQRVQRGKTFATISVPIQLRKLIAEPGGQLAP